MELLRIVVSLLLIYATCITLKCPCRKLNGCHKTEFFLSVGAAALLTAGDNGMLQPKSGM